MRPPLLQPLNQSWSSLALAQILLLTCSQVHNLKFQLDHQVHISLYLTETTANPQL